MTQQDFSRDEADASSGVEEAATRWVTPPVLHARPVEGPIDWQAAVEDVFRRFPKIMARLAE